VPHQANLRIIRATQERLGVDDSKVMVNIDRYGNTTGERFPGLRDAVEQGRLHKGDLVLIVTVARGTRPAACCCAGILKLNTTVGARESAGVQ